MARGFAFQSWQRAEEGRNRPDGGRQANHQSGAAIEAAPYLHPKLSATAVYATGEDFASMLDRAIERSGKVREVKQIELRAQRVGDSDGR
jgi:hypothetical protein